MMSVAGEVLQTKTFFRRGWTKTYQNSIHPHLNISLIQSSGPRQRSLSRFIGGTRYSSISGSYQCLLFHSLFFLLLVHPSTSSGERTKEKHTGNDIRPLPDALI